MFDWYFGNLGTLGIVVNCVGFGLGIIAFILWIVSKAKNEKLKKQRGKHDEQHHSL